MLRDRIRAEIERLGPMPFDRFMELALFDPEEGYFTTGTLRSEKAGDFLTSPEVSPWFGTTLARLVAAEAERVGTPITVVDVGAGSGSLLRPLLDTLDIAAEVWAVEASPAARKRLAESVPEAEVISSMDELPASFDGVIVANELLDNLPAAVAVRRGREWLERAVVVARDGALAYAEVEARDDVAAWAGAHAGQVDDGALVEAQLAAGSWIRGALGRLRSGALVVADYGERAENLAHRRAEGTIRTYRSHHLGPDPLLEPGATDITMDVNFTAVLAAAEAAGAQATLHRQDEFLAAHGLRAAIDDLRERELAAARRGDTMERLRLRDAVTNAETLLHPRGLGDFRVMVARV